MPRMARTTRLLCGLLAASLLVGCAPLKVPKTLKLPGQNEKPQAPTRMTALWTDTVLVEAGVVGFGGRVMFYGREGDEPIMVDGELTVYAYDESEDAQADAVPARKYVFRTEDLEKHYSKSTLGHSYSFWLPWAPVGGPQRQMSLIARFKATGGGGVVMSEMSRHFLPGSVEPTREIALTRRPGSFAAGVKQVADAAAEAPLPHTPSMTTTTISLPPRFTREPIEEGTMVEQRPIEQPPAAQPADASTSATPNPPNAGAAKTPAETTPAAAEPADSQALLREVRALREMVEANQNSSPSDHYGFRRPRARIAPKLPPTRDPARSQPRPLESLSAPPQALQAGSSTESFVLPPGAAQVRTELR